MSRYLSKSTEQLRDILAKLDSVAMMSAKEVGDVEESLASEYSAVRDELERRQALKDGISVAEALPKAIEDVLSAIGLRTNGLALESLGLGWEWDKKKKIFRLNPKSIFFSEISVQPAAGANEEDLQESVANVRFLFEKEVPLSAISQLFPDLSQQKEIFIVLRVVGEFAGRTEFYPKAGDPSMVIEAVSWLL